MLGTLISLFSIYSWNESKHWASSLKLFTGLTWDLPKNIPDGDACFFEYALLPWWSVATHQHVLWNVPCTLTIASEIAKSLTNLQKSLDSLAKVVLDNRLALDYLLEEQGGIYAVANSSCRIYVNPSSQVEANTEKIQQQITFSSRQLTINPCYSIWAEKLKTGSLVCSLWYKRTRFPFSHNPLIFSIILIYVIFHLVLCCLPYYCKSVTKTFMLKKEAWDQQV